MEPVQCEYEIIEHRVAIIKEMQAGSVTRSMSVFECPDPVCSADPADHDGRLPCRWSGKYAHGKGYNGARFPRRTCPGCAHVKRAGVPDEQSEAAGA